MTILPGSFFFEAKSASGWFFVGEHVVFVKVFYPPNSVYFVQSDSHDRKMFPESKKGIIITMYWNIVSMHISHRHSRKSLGIKIDIAYNYLESELAQLSRAQDTTKK